MNVSTSFNALAPTCPPSGDRVLAPNKAYLLQLVNATGAANVDYFATWFEGTPDLPRQ